MTEQERLAKIRAAVPLTSGKIGPAFAPESTDASIAHAVELVKAFGTTPKLTSTTPDAVLNAVINEVKRRIAAFQRELLLAKQSSSGRSVALSAVQAGNNRAIAAQIGTLVALTGWLQAFGDNLNSETKEGE